MWQQNANQRAAGTVTTMAYDALRRMPANIMPLQTTPGGSPVADASYGAGAVLWQERVVNARGRAEHQAYGNGVSGKAVLEAATGRTTDLQAETNSAVLNQHSSGTA